jgi:polysaccharide pyruvyl transferase WcaK-like protein
MAEEIIPRVRHWSVRSDKDGRRLLEYGVSAKSVTVAADMAWLIDPVPADVGKQLLDQWGIGLDRPLIGVNLANENHCFDEHPEMAAATAKALDTLAGERGARILFLCAEVRDEPTYDKAAAQRIVALMKRADLAVIAPNHYLSPRQMMSIIACCELTMSMRYHFCLFSTVQGVPFIGIERSDKVADLCWDLGWTARVKPPAYDTSEILGHAKQLRESSALETGKLKGRTQVMKDRALLNVRSLEALTRGG